MEPDVTGHLVAREPSSGRHQYACDQLCALLNWTWRKAKRDDLYTITQFGIEFGPQYGMVVVPDVVVLNTKPIGDVCTPDQVVLVAEVWSPHDSSDDRAWKFDLYAQSEVRYFWTVELGEPVLEVYEYLGDNWYRRRTNCSVMRAAGLRPHQCR